MGDALRPWAPDVWLADGDPVRMLGVPFETRMTVVRLPDGGLWIHSPVAASEARVAGVRELGRVAHLVAPDRFHHLFLGAWRARAPEAALWAAPGLARRRPDLSFTGELGDAAPDAWRGVLDQVVFAGSPLIAELVFHHRPSRTLIFTDIVQSHEPSDGFAWRTLKRWNGVLAPDGGCPRDWRLTVRDRASARRAAETILGWDFERLVLCHGRCLSEGARPFVERAFAWLV